MVVNNSCSEIGDVLLISTQAPIIGATSFSSFIDVITGTTGTRYFDKEFRYSFDGIVYSDWIELTNPNLVAIVIPEKAATVFDFKYTRAGSDVTGLLTFTSITLDGVYIQPPQRNAPTSNKFFNQIYLDDLESYDLAVNLTAKLYYHGIVPDYIVRNENPNNLVEDAEYIKFWNTVAQYYSNFKIYADLFKNIYFIRDFLLERIKQKGLFVCGDEEMADLQYLISHYYDEIRKRGTIQVFRKKGTYVVPAEEATSLQPEFTEYDVNVNGEFLRIICYDVLDEFLLNVVNEKYFGWNVGNCSPLYRSLQHQDQQLTKAYEITELGAFDLDKYPIHDEDGVIEIITDGDKEVISIAGVATGEYAGIGLEDNNTPADLAADYTLTTATDRSKMIIVDPSVGYQISFWLKFPTQDSIDNCTDLIKFGLYTWDKYYNFKYLVNCHNLIVTSTEFHGSLKVLQPDVYYFISAYVQAEDVVIPNDVRMNISSGSVNGFSLKFLDENVKYMMPYLLLYNAVGGGAAYADNDIRIYDFKIRPTNTPFSTGFIQSKNFVEIWAKNNNGQYNDTQINDTLRKFLLPYNTYFSVINL